MKSYLINLDRTPERLIAASQRFAACNIMYERFPAIDGRALDEEHFSSFVKARPRDGRSWSKGQIGCFLSHYSIWQKIAESADEYAAIFEDDLHISEDLGLFVKETSWIPKDCDLIRLETSTNKVWLSAPVAHQNGRLICEVKSTTWCAGAYIMSKKAAQHVISIDEKYHSPTDIFLMSYEDSPLPARLFMAQVTPALCIQDKFLHKNSADIRFTSSIMDNDDEAPTWRVRLRHALRKSPFQIIKKIIKGYKRIPYAHRVTS